MMSTSVESRLMLRISQKSSKKTETSSLRLDSTESLVWLILPWLLTTSTHCSITSSSNEDSIRMSSHSTSAGTTDQEPVNSLLEDGITTTSRDNWTSTTSQINTIGSLRLITFWLEEKISESANTDARLLPILVLPFWLVPLMISWMFWVFSRINFQRRSQHRWGLQGTQELTSLNLRPRWSPLWSWC